jgi:type VI protein secretion system component Hcp
MTLPPGGTGSTGAGAGKAGLPAFDPVVVTTPVSTASTQLMANLFQGKEFPTATVVLFSPGTTQPAETYTFGRVVVSSLKTAADGAAGGQPLTTVSLQFVSFMVALPADATGGGPTSAGYDTTTNPGG